MFQRIVIATDFSEAADTAARYGLGLARTFGGQVELVHAWRLPIELADSMALLDPSVVSGSRRGAEAQLAAAAQKLGITVTTFLEGPPDLTVVAHARTSQADLLVTGTRGRTGLAHVFLGSVAERIARTADVPVLSVPHGISVAKDVPVAPKSILVPIDFEAGSAEILQNALAIAAVTQGRVSAVHAWEMPFYFAAGSELAVEAERQENARFDAWVSSAAPGQQVERLTRYGSPGDVIREVAAEQHADLVMMATAGRSGIEHFMMGSVTERTIRTAHLPVLTLRRPTSDQGQGIPSATA